MKSCNFAPEMSLIDIILLAVALAMDCLTVSIVSGVLVFTVDSLSSCVPAVASGKAERVSLQQKSPLV